MLILVPAVTYGQTVTAVWDPSPPSEQVTGYQVCLSTTSMACNVQLANVGTAAYTFSPSAGVLHYVAVRATNALGAGPYSSEVSFSIPSFAAVPSQSSAVGATITPLNMSVTDPDGSPLTYTHTGLPVGLSLNSTTGQITGAPSVAGTYNVTIFVNDGLATVSRSFAWVVSMSVSVVSAAPSAGSGNQQTFVLQYSDTLGATDLATTRVRFATGDGSAGMSACTVSYTRSAGTIALQNDAGSAWLPSGTPGTGSLSNTQCTINLANTSVSISGNTLTLNLAVSFNASFAGAKGIFMLATSNGGSGTGWVSRGSWTVTAPASGVPSAVSVTPGSGSGTSATFVLSYSDTVGATDLATARVRVVPTSAGSGGADNVCQVTYTRSANTVSLMNDAGTSTLVGTLGTGTLSNSQCTVNLASSSVSLSGNNLTFTLAVNFASAFAGDKNIYMRAVSNDGTNSGWVQRGTWTVPGSGGPGVPSAVSVTPGSGSGLSGTFVMVYSDTAGVADLATAKARIVSTSSDGPSTSAGTCTISYDPSGNSLSLTDDAGSTWIAGTIGSGSVGNSQCAINLAGSTAVASGNNLTLSLAITFTSGFVGTKNVYMRATTDTAANTGWQQRATWTVALPPSGTPNSVSVTPNTGAGRSANFVLRYSDTAGAADLQNGRVRFVASSLNSPGDGVGTCTVKYNPASRSVSLLNNAGTTWVSATIGSGTLSNSQCTVNLASSSVTTSGNYLTLTLPITFAQSFNGGKRTYMAATNLAGTNSGWALRGTWLVQ
jgi:hypothetical protein